MRIVIKGRHPNKEKPTGPIYEGSLGGKLPTLKSKKNMKKFCVRLGRYSKSMNTFHKIYPMWMESEPIAVMRLDHYGRKYGLRRESEAAKIAQTLLRYYNFDLEQAIPLAITIDKKYKDEIEKGLWEYRELIRDRERQELYSRKKNYREAQARELELAKMGFIKREASNIPMGSKVKNSKYVIAANGLLNRWEYPRSFENFEDAVYYKDKYLSFYWLRVEQVMDI